MAVTITIRHRNNAARKYEKTLLDQFPEDARDALLKDLKKTAAVYVKDGGVKLAAAMEKAANNKLRQVAGFIARNVIGYPTTLTEPGEIPGYTEVEVDGRSGLDWLALSGKYRVYGKSKNNDAHFLHKGDLRRAVAASGPAILKATGGIQVQVQTVKQTGIGAVGGKTTERVANILVTYAPAARSSGILPGMTSGNPLASANESLSFEKRLGFAPDIMAKLKGPGNGFIHRPLIQPVVSYWLLYRVPQEISRVLGSFAKRTPGGRVHALQGGTTT